METTDATKSASYLDLLRENDQKGKLVSKIYDKRDDFNFPVVNFPYLRDNVNTDASPAYGFCVPHSMQIISCLLQVPGFPEDSTAVVA